MVFRLQSDLVIADFVIMGTYLAYWKSLSQASVSWGDYRGGFRVFEHEGQVHKSGESAFGGG